MSDDRVELVRTAWRAYEDGDPASVIEFLDPEIEVYSAPEVGNPGTFHGHEGFARWMAHWFEAWEEFTQEILTVEPVGERCVLTDTRQTARARGGLEFERTATYLYEVRNEKAVYLGLYIDAEAARAAALERESA